MITKRLNTFETNSSSTHCLTISTKSNYDLFENNELILFNDEYKNNKFITFEDAFNIILNKNSEFKNITLDVFIECWLNSCKGLKYDDDKLKCNLLTYLNDCVRYDLYLYSYKSYKDKNYQLDFMYEEYTHNNDILVGFGYYGYEG